MAAALNQETLMIRALARETVNIASLLKMVKTLRILVATSKTVADLCQRHTYHEGILVFACVNYSIFEEPKDISYP